MASNLIAMASNLIAKGLPTMFPDKAFATLLVLTSLKSARRAADLGQCGRGGRRRAHLRAFQSDTTCLGLTPSFTARAGGPWGVHVYRHVLQFHAVY